MSKKFRMRAGTIGDRATGFVPKNVKAENKKLKRIKKPKALRGRI
jgi:hypothetical protein